MAKADFLLSMTYNEDKISEREAEAQIKHALGATIYRNSPIVSMALLGDGKRIDPAETLPGLAFNLNGYQMVAWIQTEVQSGKACGIWVGYRPGDGFVTAWYRCGDREWNNGHYEIATKKEAMADALRRM